MRLWLRVTLIVQYMSHRLLHDPVVAPPGQFAIYNSISENLRNLMVLTMGHAEYPNKETEHEELNQALCEFFKDL